MPKINFFTEDVSFTLKDKKALRGWLIASLKKESKTCGDLNYIFCSDEYLKQVNIDYLNHDNYTAIITFDYSEDNIVAGDVYIVQGQSNAAAVMYNGSSGAYQNDYLRV